MTTTTTFSGRDPSGRNSSRSGGAWGPLGLLGVVGLTAFAVEPLIPTALGFGGLHGYGGSYLERL